MIGALDDARARVEVAAHVERVVAGKVIGVLRAYGRSDRHIATVLGVSRNRLELLVRQCDLPLEQDWAGEWVDSIWAAVRVELGSWVRGPGTAQRRKAVGGSGRRNETNSAERPWPPCAFEYRNIGNGDRILVYRDERPDTGPRGEPACHVPTENVVVLYLTRDGERRLLSMSEIGLPEGDQAIKDESSQHVVLARIRKAVERTFHVL